MTRTNERFEDGVVTRANEPTEDWMHHSPSPPWRVQGVPEANLQIMHCCIGLYVLEPFIRMKN